MPADEEIKTAVSDQRQIEGRPGWGVRIGRAFQKANSLFTYIIGLPALTMLGGLIVGYYQYLNAYQEKISARAENDVKTAAATYTGISTTFSRMQTLQQALFVNVTDALDERVSVDERALAAKYARSISETYESAWLKLLESGDVMARSAETDIDWAIDMKRDPKISHYPNSDPLSRSLLGSYDFDCNEDLPKVVSAPRMRASNACRVAGNPNNGDDSFSTNICPKGSVSSDPKRSVTVQWYSAKHQVLTMQYCLQVLHQRLAKARSWALHGEPSQAASAIFRAERDQIQRELDVQAARLEAFMGLALFQIEAIGYRYRPVSFICHFPFATPIVSLWNDSCTPVQTTPYEGLRIPGSSPPVNVEVKQVSAATTR